MVLKPALQVLLERERENQEEEFRIRHGGYARPVIAPTTINTPVKKAKTKYIAAKHTHEVTTPPHEVNNISRKSCNCKKSNCLKLYCECFQQGAYCSEDCNCIGCHNTTVRSSLVFCYCFYITCAHKNNSFIGLRRATPNRDSNSARS